MKILVTGAAGLLGKALLKEIALRGHTPIGFSKTEMDVTDPVRCRLLFAKHRPHAVVHCAAFTKVDAAEHDPETAFAVNHYGAETIARLCLAFGAKMMYLSTDYVFDGSGNSPWDADASPPNPLSVYGKSKLAGENAVRALIPRHFILRVAGSFGPDGNSFVKTILHLAKERRQLSVVSDQIGTPTYTPDLSRLMVDMLETEKYGTYHATNEGEYISWHAFAEEIVRMAGLNTEILPTTTAVYCAGKAPRPLNSRLDCSKLQNNGFAPLPHWRDALKRYLQTL